MPTFIRHYYRHKNGWSPQTADDAVIWKLRKAKSDGQPYQAEYSTRTNTLKIPFRIPRSGFLALKFLGQHAHYEKGGLVIEGIDFRLSERLCNKLCIKMNSED